MEILSIISQKGGVGKTTLATCLAVEAINQGKRVAVIDLDPQATATFWSDVRPSDDPAVLSIQPVRLPSVLKASEQAGTDFVIIDSAAVSKDIAYAAAEAADFALVPFKAAVFDINSVAQTVQIIKQVGAPFALVCTFVPPQGNETAEAQEIIDDLGSDFCPVLIGNRKAFFRAQAKGCAVQEQSFDPDGKATEEIKRLYEYTRIHLDKYKKDAGDERKLA